MGKVDVSTSCNECRYHYSFWDDNGHICQCIFDNSIVDKIHILNCLDSTKSNTKLSGCKYFLNFLTYMKHGKE